MRWATSRRQVAAATTARLLSPRVTSRTTSGAERRRSWTRAVTWITSMTIRVLVTMRWTRMLETVAMRRIICSNRSVSTAWACALCQQKCRMPGPRWADLRRTAAGTCSSLKAVTQRGFQATTGPQRMLLVGCSARSISSSSRYPLARTSRTKGRRVQLAGRLPQVPNSSTMPTALSY